MWSSAASHLLPDDGNIVVRESRGGPQSIGGDVIPEQAGEGGLGALVAGAEGRNELGLIARAVDAEVDEAWVEDGGNSAEQNSRTQDFFYGRTVCFRGGTAWSSHTEM